MYGFIKSSSYDKISVSRQTELFALMESKDPKKITHTITQATEQERMVLDERYLAFIKAYLKDPTASLFDLAKISIPQNVFENIINQNPDVLRFEYSLSEQAFSLFVDLAGSFVHSHVDLEEYLSFHSNYIKLFGDYDYSSLAIGALKEYLPTITYREGWLGALLDKVRKLNLIAIAFDHCDCEAAWEGALYKREFLMFVLGFMNSDELTWDFFQSSPLKFPSEIYALQYNWKYITTTPIIRPPSYGQFETSLWIVSSDV